MEHREPPRIAIGDRVYGPATEDAGGRLPLRAADAAFNRDPRNLGRGALSALIATAGATALLCMGWQAMRTAVTWLHHQSQYQVPLDDVDLVNAPPAWFRGGPQRFLEQLRQNAAAPRRISQLDVGPDQVAAEFKKYAWVEDVATVTYAPGRIRVALRYRQPVAWVNLLRGHQRVVDENGIILPAEDIDSGPLGALVKITGDGLLPPSDPRPGVIWKLQTHAGEMDEPEVRILAAARLAGFLIQPERFGQAAACPALRILEIIVSDFHRRGLFVMNAEGAEIWWEDAPGQERAGTPSALEKWRMLVDWQKTTRARLLVKGDFWAFSRNGLRFNCPHPDSPHRPRAGSGATAAGPGQLRKPADSG
jgi:hypothetical protein